jgi:histidinol-phosphate aminotransferase
VRERARLTDGLRALGWTVEPSSANFVFAAPPPGITPSDVARGLRRERILVRTFSLPGIDHGVRITVGDGPATDLVLRAIAAINLL